MALGCPNCKAKEGFAENDIILGLCLIIKFNENGITEYSGTTEVLWDFQDLDPEQEPYVCLNCNEPFSFPIEVEDSNVSES